MPRVVTGSGYQIGYAEEGSGEAVPVIFLHGVGSDKSVWRPQLAHFGKTRRSVAFDYPGYGESDPAPEGTTRDDYASAIISAMNALGIDRAHVCGLSLGGIVAIAMHSADSRRCASLVLADTFAVHPEGRAIYERAMTASENLQAMAEARVDVLLAQPASPRVRREVVETMGRIDPAAYCIGAEAVWLADQRERAERIGIPTLILVGDHDLITPPDLSVELARLIRSSQMQVIHDAGHISNLEKPAAFNQAVEQLLLGFDS
ncbi:MAG TPA: alpha/beta fold hydrolase [Sphingomicrobium sp.]|jgi:3-oxoadipate enol-lactonase|nr:alpha/beta fold hydrolase [Sphingomicrobium sp.]